MGSVSQPITHDSRTNFLHKKIKELLIYRILDIETRTSSAILAGIVTNAQGRPASRLEKNNERITQNEDSTSHLDLDRQTLDHEVRDGRRPGFTNCKDNSPQIRDEDSCHLTRVTPWELRFSQVPTKYRRVKKKPFSSYFSLRLPSLFAQ
jgi:hypothetical protein